MEGLSSFNYELGNQALLSSSGESFVLEKSFNCGATQFLLDNMLITCFDGLKCWNYSSKHLSSNAL